MSRITTKIRAVVGALGILVFASPLAAQTHHRGAQLRYAATYVQRSAVGLRYGPWIRGPRWRARPAWVYGPVMRGWRGRAWVRPVPRWGWAYARPVRPALRRAWRRAWIAERYRAF